jgi:hypothetical protein
MLQQLTKLLVFVYCEKLLGVSDCLQPVAFLHQLHKFLDSGPLKLKTARQCPFKTIHMMIPSTTNSCKGVPLKPSLFQAAQIPKNYPCNLFFPVKYKKFLDKLSLENYKPVLFFQQFHNIYAVYLKTITMNDLLKSVPFLRVFQIRIRRIQN